MVKNMPPPQLAFPSLKPIECSEHSEHVRRSEHSEHVRRSEHSEHVRRSEHSEHVRRSEHSEHVRRSGYRERDGRGFGPPLYHPSDSLSDRDAPDVGPGDTPEFSRRIRSRSLNSVEKSIRDNKMLGDARVKDKIIHTLRKLCDKNGMRVVSGRKSGELVAAAAFRAYHELGIPMSPGILSKMLGVSQRAVHFAINKYTPEVDMTIDSSVCLLVDAYLSLAGLIDHDMRDVVVNECVSYVEEQLSRRDEAFRAWTRNTFVPDIVTGITTHFVQARGAFELDFTLWAEACSYSVKKVRTLQSEFASTLVHTTSPAPASPASAASVSLLDE